jgi:hypothetical protein
VAKAKLVRLHTCFDMEFGEKLERICACAQYRTPYVAAQMVKRGQALTIVDNQGRVLPYDIYQVGGMNRRTPRAATIDNKHIIRAYINGQLEDQIRIDVYGQMNKAMLDSLIVKVPDEGDFRLKPWKDPNRHSRVFLAWGICIENFKEHKGPKAPVASEKELYTRFRTMLGFWD